MEKERIQLQKDFSINHAITKTSAGKPASIINNYTFNNCSIIVKPKKHQ